MAAGVGYLYAKYTGAIDPEKLVYDNEGQMFVTGLAFVMSITGFVWAAISAIVMTI